MQKKNHSEERNLFLPLIFQKKKKGEITTNKPYFEAKRWTSPSFIYPYLYGNLLSKVTLLCLEIYPIQYF